MPDPIIRRATSQDAPLLAAFDAVRLSRDAAELEPLIAAALARGRDKVWLAEHEGRLLGHAKAFWVEPRHQARRGPSKGVRTGFHLMGLEVSEDVRRQGVGAALTRARLEWITAQGADEAFYVTNAQNTASLALHASLGFETIDNVRYGTIQGDGPHLLGRIALHPPMPLRFGPVDRDQLVDLYDAVGWSAYTREPDVLEAAIRGSTWVATRWQDERLIALCRMISDDATMAYLQDVLVHPELQRHGLGRSLVELGLNRFDHVRQIVLLTDDRPEQHAFYTSLGLEDIRDSPLHCFARMPGL